MSTATVSYVLNGREDQRISPETWKRVMHEVHLMGYESSAVAKALATGNNNVVGLYAPRLGRLQSRAYENAVFTSQLAESLRDRGYQLQFVGELCRSTTIKTLGRHRDARRGSRDLPADRLQLLLPAHMRGRPRGRSFPILPGEQRLCRGGRAGRRHGGRTALVFEAYAEPRLNARAGAGFDAAFAWPGGSSLEGFAAAQPEGTVFVAQGALLGGAGCAA